MTDVRSVTFSVPSRPLAKGRPRFANGRAYTPATTREHEARIRAAAAKHAPDVPWDGPIVVRVSFRFRRPKDGRRHHLSRPDLDNLIKILDALNGLIWVDDAQLVRITAEKVYSETEATCITVRRIR